MNINILGYCSSDISYTTFIVNMSLLKLISNPIQEFNVHFLVKLWRQERPDSTHNHKQGWENIMPKKTVNCKINTAKRQLVASKNYK